MPVGALLRPIEPLNVEDSLRRAAEAMRGHGLSSLPVASGGRLIGLATQEGIARALAFGMDDRAAVASLVTAMPRLIATSATGAEALRAFHETGATLLVAVDGAGQVLGVITPLDLVVPRREELRPRMVGGMATPFGVYLTNGAVRGGASGWALAATGFLLFGLYVLATLLANSIEPLVRRLPTGAEVETVMLGATALGLFLLGVRSLPLAGVHAAEHMVVHAMERGEDLAPEVVARMPRVHPRCGTNLAAAAMLFLGVQGIEWLGPDPQLRMLLGALAAILLWRPLGSLAQLYVTTKPPTRAQIDDAIRAATELVRRYQVAPRTAPTALLRFANSGLPQILFGSLALTLVLELLHQMGLLPRLRVYF
jgi:hypothetical protein